MHIVLQLKLLVTDVSLPQINWKTAHGFGPTCSRETPVSKLAVGPSDDACPSVCSA